MRLDENSTFILLVCGVFCVTLGASTLLFSLIEGALSQLSFLKPLLLFSSFSLGLGALLLLRCRER